MSNRRRRRRTAKQYAAAAGQTSGARQPVAKAEGEGAPRGPRRRVLIPLTVAGVAVAIAVAATAWGPWWAGPNAHEIPAINEDGLNPYVQAAIRLARDQVEQSPNDAGQWGKLGQVLYAHSFHQQAVEALQVAHELDPADARWPYLIGTRKLDTDVQQALDWFRVAEQSSPDAGRRRPIVRLRKVEVLMDLGQLQQAEQLVESVLQDHPRNRHALFLKARITAEREDWQSCRSLLEPVARQERNRLDVQQLMAQTYQRLAMTEQAAATLQHLEQLPQTPASWPDPILQEVMQQRRDSAWVANQSEALLKRREFGEAAALLQRMAADEPQVPDWKGRLARVWVQSGEMEKAAAVLRPAVQQHPDAAELWFLLGVTQHQQKQFADAVDSLRQAIRAKQDYSEAYLNLGMAHRELQQLEKAVAAFEQAASLQPSLQTQFNLAVTLGLANRNSEAIQALSRCIELDSTVPELHLQLAELLIEEGRLAEARAALGNARQLAPQHPQLQKLTRQLQP